MNNIKYGIGTGGCLEDLQKWRKIIHALSRINYSFKRGSFNFVHGPSGCGKSTLIRLAGTTRNALQWANIDKWREYN